MALKDEIAKALGAHGQWKARLAAAIDSGTVDAKVEDVRKDNVCPFGQWLYGSTITAAEKSGGHYEEVRKLHADFHLAAAEVLTLVGQGKKDDAKKMMGISGGFSKASSGLSLAMTKWQGAF